MNDRFVLQVTFESAKTVPSQAVLKSVLNAATRYIPHDVELVVQVQTKYAQRALAFTGKHLFCTNDLAKVTKLPTRCIFFTDRVVKNDALPGLRAKYACQDVRICKI